MRGIKRNEFAQLTGLSIDHFLPEEFDFEEDELEIHVVETTMDQLLSRYSYEYREGSDCGHEFTRFHYFAIVEVDGVHEVCEAEDHEPLGEGWGGDYIGLDAIRFVVEYHRHFADWPKRNIESCRTLTVYTIDHGEAERLDSLRDLCLSAISKADYNQVLRIATILRVSLPDPALPKRRRF